MEKENLKKNVLCYQSLMALLFSLFEDEKPDDDFLREAEEIIAQKSGLPENSIFRYDLDKQGVLSDVYSTYYTGGGECER